MPETVVMGPRNGVPATHSASLRAFTPVFDGLWTRVDALLLSRGAPRGDERIFTSSSPPAQVCGIDF